MIQKRHNEKTGKHKAVLDTTELTATSGGFFIAAGFGCAPVVAARPAVAAYTGVVVL